MPDETKPADAATDETPKKTPRDRIVELRARLDTSDKSDRNLAALIDAMLDGG